MDELWTDDRRRRRRGRGRRRVIHAESEGELDTREDELLAERKLSFLRDAAKFAIWTGLALTFAFPLGVILLIWGAPRRIRRYSKLYLEPSARERLTRAERRRRRRSEDLEAATDATPIGRPDRIVVDAPSEATVPRRAPLSMAKVVASGLASLEPRLTKIGIEVRRNFDGEGEVTGDVAELSAATLQVLSRAIDGLERSKVASPRLHLDLGENLAGSAVWLRVRENAPAGPAERERPGLAIAEHAVSAHGGTLEFTSDLAGAETLMTLRKSG